MKHERLTAPPTTQENVPITFNHLLHTAQTVCADLSIDDSVWSGVVYDKSRKTQIHEDMAYLKGFYKDIKLLDKQRWREFRKNFCTLINQDIEHLAQLIHYTDFNTDLGQIWIGAANAELDYLILFLYSHTNFKNLDFSQTVDIITSGTINNIVASFLRYHVGEGSRRVKREVKENFTYNGFDGSGRTCPVVEVQKMAVTYFVYTAAEYMLMYQILEHEKNVGPVKSTHVASDAQ